VTEPFTRLQDITSYTVHYKPKDSAVALWDCPKAIRDAARGLLPEPKRFGPGEVIQAVWPVLLSASGLVLFAGIPVWSKGFTLGHGLFDLVAAIVFPFVVVPVWIARGTDRDYSRDKGIFDSYAANPDLYRDEIYKVAVSRLPYLDFKGKHLSVQDGAKVGRFEAQVIEAFRKLGVHQETKVENRGRPYLIHQYELTELKWGRWENGDTKNYVLDIAILWPERRIKYDIEIDDPSHQSGTRPLKDRNRDDILTERGWFTRRLNHNFLADPAKMTKALNEILSIVYFFAKYANDEPIDWEVRMVALMQNRRFRKQQKALLGARPASPSTVSAGGAS
jgi:very-short-patch-repair endonuclease